MIVLPVSWLVILVLNTWTILRLRRETRRLYILSSIKHVQICLVIITLSYIVIWAAYSATFFVKRRTFALELGAKWAFGIGFIDAMVYGKGRWVQL